MPSRRAFLQTSSLAASLVLMNPLYGAVRRGSRPFAIPATRLFFEEDDLPRLRRLFESPAFASLRERLLSIDRSAERRWIAEEIRYNDHLYDIARASNNAQAMSFVYVLSGDEDAAQLALEMVREIMKFERWDYFLEGGDRVFGLQRAPLATMAISITTDFLGDLVDSEERLGWLRTMGERGLEPSYLALYGMRYPERVEGWTMDETSTYFEHRPGDQIDLSNWPHILDRTNLKAVPASALAVGTVAYQHHLGQSENTERWLEQAIYSIGTFRDLFARDGSYDEGVSYANYTALHLAQAMEVLRRHQDVDLYDLINWPGYVEYLREMSMPTAADAGSIVNFGDNSGGGTAAVPFWVAGRSFDRSSQWFGGHLAASRDEWSLLWFNPTVEAEPPPARPHVWRSDLDWLVARTGYGADDLIVAMRSGGPANHEHADRNSIIVKWRGEQLVADPYRPPYSFSDPAWMMRTTAGHSAVLIDGEGHQYHDGSEGTNASDASARVIRMMERNDYMAWTSDATPAYQLVNDDVTFVTRTVVVIHGLPAVIVLDKVGKRSRLSRIQARFYGYNRDGHGTVVAAGDHFRSQRPNASILGRAHALQGVEISSAFPPIPEETARLHPFAEVATRHASLLPFLITVLVPGPEEGAAVDASIRRLEDGTYEIECTGAGGRATCRVMDTDEVPEFAVTVAG